MDQRLTTFLTLCQTMNYRKAAQQLHLTQPAVTRQIQSLERELGVKLFSYDGRRLEKTTSCPLLEGYAISLRYNDQELRAALLGTKRTHLRVGATKTVGDYVIPDLVATYLDDPRHTLSLTVDNTSRLLELLESDKLDFAVVEGFFDRSRYGYQLFRREEFTGICAHDHPFAGRIVGLEELFGETLLLRESGSGTRNIFQGELAELGHTLGSFGRVVEISSFSLIKSLLRKGLGVTFAYQAIARGDARFAYFTISSQPPLHEINIVYLKNTQAPNYVEAFLSGAKEKITLDAD